MWFQRLFGDTSTFAIAVALEQDPSPPRPMHESLRKSWGTLAIYARGRCLTRNTTDGRASDAVHWYLRPFIEWLDENAVRLLNEEPFPGLPPEDELGDSVDWLDATLDAPVLSRTEEEDDRWFEERSRWQERRCLRYGLPGAVAPFVLFRRLGDHVEIAWDNEGHPATRPGVTFIETRGAVVVPAAELAAVLRELVRCVVEQISAAGELALAGPLGNGTGVGEDAWGWLVHPACRTLLAEPAQTRERDQLRGDVQVSGALVRHSLLTALLRAVPATEPGQLRPFLQTQPPDVPLDRCLVQERSAPPTSVREAWSAGYERARVLRRAMKWGLEPAPLDSVLPTLGLAIREAELVHGIQCAVASFGGERVTATLATGPGMRRSMRLATALGHVLFDVVTDHPFGIVSGPWSHAPTNARAKAFGAMLLMPEEAIREMARDTGAVDASLVNAVMSRFGTGLAATTWHLYHLRLVSDDGRMALIKSVRDAGLE